MKNNKRIAISFILPAIFCLSSCVVYGGKSGVTFFTIVNSSVPNDYASYERSEVSSSVRETNFELVSSTREGMEEMYASFFEETFENNSLRVQMTDSLDIVHGESSVEYVIGTSSHYKGFESKKSDCDLYVDVLVDEEWAFIDEDGRKISANADKSFYTVIREPYYFVGEEAYQNTYKRYKREIDLLGYIEDVTTTNEIYKVKNPESLENAVYQTYLSEDEDGYKDIHLAITVKDENGDDLELANMWSTSKDGLVQTVSYFYWYGFEEMYQGVKIGDFFSREYRYMFFTYLEHPENVDLEIPDITLPYWENRTSTTDQTEEEAS